MTGALLAVAAVVVAGIVARRGVPTEPQRPGPVVPGWQPTLARFDRALERAALDLHAGRAVLLLAAVVLAAALAGLVLWGPVGGAAAATAVAVAGPVGLWLARGRRRALLEAELPAALEAVARSLRSGASLVQAVGEARDAVRGPLADELAVVTSAVATGASLADAVEAWALRAPLSSIRMTATALALAADTGGARAQAIDGVATTLRDRLALDAEIRALASQAQASAIVVAALPLAFLVATGASGLDSARFLFETRLGLVCLGAAVTLEVLGAVWMHAITRSVS